LQTVTIGTDTYGIFKTETHGQEQRVHFLWGKKDFMLTLVPAKGDDAVRYSGTKGLAVGQLQYFFGYEWLNYDKVGGHGLAHDEVRWSAEGVVRHVELPKNFRQHAIEVAAQALGLSQQPVEEAS